MKSFILTIVITISFINICKSEEINYKTVEEYLIKRGYSDVSDEPPFGRMPNVLSFNKNGTDVIVKYTDDGIIYESSMMIKSAKNSPFETIEEGKWIFSKLIGGRRIASVWINDCFSGLNYNKDIKTADFSYFCYPTLDDLTLSFTAQH